jgi:hypothetical protein
MRLRYRLAAINLCILLLLEILSWPLAPDRFKMFKYIDPILFWDFGGVISALNHARLMMGMSLSSQAFGTIIEITINLLVIIAGTIQWLIIGILLERIIAMLKLKRGGEIESAKAP